MPYVTCFLTRGFFLVLTLGRLAQASLLDPIAPIVHHSMVARCSAHLLAGELQRPVAPARVIDSIHGLSKDARLNKNQRHRLSVVLSDLRSRDATSVTQVWRGNEEISAYARGMDVITADVDEVIRPHLRPARHSLESAVYIASLIQIGAETVAMWGANIHGDKSLALYHNAMTTIGAVAFFSFDVVMGLVGDYRIRHGWRPPADGATDRGRRSFEMRLGSLLEQLRSTSGTLPAPMILSRSEFLPAEFARALREANSPGGLPAVAIKRLVASRDRFIPVLRELALDRPYWLSIDYVFLNDADGQPMLITVRTLKALAIWPGSSSGGRRKRVPKPELARDVAPGLDCAR